ncbi:hypothetical protein ScPMuIL_011607 [Solemya velum]
MTNVNFEDVIQQLAKTNVGVENELSFKGKGLKLNNADDAREIVEAIEKCDCMTALRMEGNTLGVEAAEVIAKALEKHPEFERALWSDMFTGRLKTEIPKVLRHLGAAIISANAHLVEIDLSDNAFGPNGVVGLVDLLKSSSCYTLKELRLNNNGLGIGGGKMLAQSLIDCHSSSCAAGKPLALKVFISGRNRLENDGATALSQAFKTIGTLEEIAMPQNGINPPGISALAAAFSVNTNLRVLNLNDNTFTADGAEMIAKVLPKLQKLEVINFGDCLLRTKGAKAIGEVLKDGQHKLQQLILSGNEIKTMGACVIVEAMEDKKELQKLDLDSNQFGEEGVDVIKGMMESIDKDGILGSLSDDEGSDDDEDDVEDDEGQDENEDTKQAITPAKMNVTANDFLQFPSPTKLVHMGPGRAGLFKEIAGDVEETVKMIMKVSLSIVKNDAEITNMSCECIDPLFENLFKSQTDVYSTLIINTLLVHMGVLKGEDKKFKPPSDITGPLIVLEYAVRQTYFPKFSKEVLQIFVSKPHPLLEKSSEARHKLLQTLYTF